MVLVALAPCIANLQVVADLLRVKVHTQEAPHFQAIPYRLKTRSMQACLSLGIILGLSFVRMYMSGKMWLSV